MFFKSNYNKLTLAPGCHVYNNSISEYIKCVRLCVCVWMFSGSCLLCLCDREQLFQQSASSSSFPFQSNTLTLSLLPHYITIWQDYINILALHWSYLFTQEHIKFDCFCSCFFSQWKILKKNTQDAPALSNSRTRANKQTNSTKLAQSDQMLFSLNSLDLRRVIVCSD